MTATTALVLGGYGAVGQHIVSGLRAHGATAHAAGRDRQRADRFVDLEESHLSSLREALDEVTVVVNASGSENPRVAEVAGEHGCAFVDVTATNAYIRELSSSQPLVPVVLNVGLAPGLTNLVAAAVHRESPGPLDIAVVLGAGEHHGLAASAWTFGLLGRRFVANGHSVRNFTQASTFMIPGRGRRRLVRVDFSDQHALSLDLSHRVRTYFGLDSRLASASLAVLTWVPGASRLPRSLQQIPMPGGETWVVLARSATGYARWVRGVNQSRATAAVAVAATLRASDLTPGIHHGHHVLDLEELIATEGFDFGDTRARPEAPA